MAEVTERDPLAIRRLILEVYKNAQAFVKSLPNIWRSMAFRTHKRMCEAMGEDFIDYPEFEFWFSRFARGNFELDYDRSSDPKAHSFTDLPLDVFDKVGEYLELKDRMQLRDVSKDIRAHVDNWDLKVTEFQYYNSKEWYLKAKSKLYRARDLGQNENTRFYRDPISFLMSVLKLPNLQVEKLKFCEHDEYWKELIKRLDKSNRKLHVKEIDIVQYYQPKIDLHFMIPGVLEDIKMVLWNPTREDFYEMIASEQCQSAKMVYIDSPTPTSEFPLKALYNCPRFTLRLGGGSADGLKSKFLKNLMKNGKVQTCVLYISNCFGAPSQIMKYFNEPEAMVPNFPMLRRYPISGINDFYELEYRENAVRLERKQ